MHKLYCMYKLYCKKLPVKRRIKSVYNGEGRKTFLSFVYMSSRSPSCPPGVFPAPAFVADFPPVAPNCITVRTTYASKIWAQLTKNLLTRSGTERFRENIFLQNQAQKASGRTFMAMSSLGGRSDYEMRQRKARIQI